MVKALPADRSLDQKQLPKDGRFWTIKRHQIVREDVNITVHPVMLAAEAQPLDVYTKKAGMMKSRKNVSDTQLADRVMIY